MSTGPRHACKIHSLATRSKFLLVAFLAATFVLPLSAANEPAPLPPPLDKSKAQDLLRSLAFFEHNEGQVDDRVLFLTQGLGYVAYLTRDGATLVFSESSRSASGRTTSTEKVVRLNIVGIDPHPEVIGSEERPGITSYYSGADPKQWHTRIPQFAKVIYRHAYPGIDLVFEIRDGRLEYDFLIAPHADPNLIRVNVEGGTPHRTATGDVLVRFGKHNDFTLKKPDAYQSGHEDQVTNVRYSLRGRDMTFAINNYNHDLPLLIDPALIFSTFLGGDTSPIQVSALAVDSSGAAYVAGAAPGGWPTTPGSYQIANADGTTGYDDGFLSKLSPDGSSLVYSTYFGGTGNDQINGVAVDSSDQATVAGWGFHPPGSAPTCPPLAAYMFISRLNAAGSALVYSTLFCSSTFGFTDVALDRFGNAYAPGSVFFPAAFPLTNAIQTYPLTSTDEPAVVVKLDTAGAIAWATFLGDAPAIENQRIAVDASDNAYILDGFAPTTANALEPNQGLNQDGNVTISRQNCPQPGSSCHDRYSKVRLVRRSVGGYFKR